MWPFHRHEWERKQADKVTLFGWPIQLAHKMIVRQCITCGVLEPIRRVSWFEEDDDD
jgi:hypothetical protein